MPPSQLSRRRIKIHPSEPKDPSQELPADDKAMDADRLAEEPSDPDAGSEEEENEEEPEDLTEEKNSDQDETESKVEFDQHSGDRGDLFGSSDNNESDG